MHRSMGRDWLYSGGGDGGGRSRGGGKSTSSAGCMSAIYNLLDIQHHHFHFRHPSFVSESTVNDNFCLQGIEAPRNSLESPEVEEQTNFNIPVGRIQIETKRSTFSDDLSCCNSPVTKTPNLVARLMGLDLLPEYSSPRSSSSDHRSHSLPATPRLSTASRLSTDNGYHHRLSLHVDKENCNGCKSHEHETSHMKTVRRRSEVLVNRQDDDRSTLYAKQTRNKHRRFGTDITNTVSPTRNKHRRRDSNLDLLKPKKSPARETTPLSNSPKLRLLDIKSNLNKPTSSSSKVHETTPLMKREKVVKDDKVKRIARERYDLRLKKMHQHENVFVSRKKSASRLPDHVLNVKNRRKCLSFKKEMASSSSSPTRLSQQQVSLPSNMNSSYNSNDTHNLNTTATATTTSATANCFSFSDGERDMGRSMRRLLSTTFETEGIVIEIESEILDNLVDKIVTEMVAPEGLTG